MIRLAHLGIALAMFASGCASARTSVTTTATADDQNKGEQKPESGAEALRQRQAVSRVLRDFHDAMEGVAARRVVELLDDSFQDMPRFEDAITALMRQTIDRRIFFRESSWNVKGDRASLIVDAEMILTLRNRTRTEQRRRDRIQFDFRRGSKGWVIQEISPRSFFAP